MDITLANINLNLTEAKALATVRMNGRAGMTYTEKYNALDGARLLAEYMFTLVSLPTDAEKIAVTANEQENARAYRREARRLLNFVRENRAPEKNAKSLLLIVSNLTCAMTALEAEQIASIVATKHDTETVEG